jgi:predicted DNA-binding transcriptional regulator AlpA
MKRDRESDENQAVKAEEFMRMLDISPNTFQKLLKEGKVPRPLPLGTRNRRWSRSVVNDFLNQHGKYNTNNNAQL